MSAQEIVDDYPLEVEEYVDGIADENPLHDDLDDWQHEWEEFLWEQEVEEPARRAALEIRGAA